MTLLNRISNSNYNSYGYDYDYNYDLKDNTHKHGCRGCNRNLTGDNPASIYQRQKIIQNTVRVHSSLYSMNLAALSSYQPPLNTYQLINRDYIVPPKTYWNQMSDRATPSRQLVKVTNTASSTRHTITRHRPGALSPGGEGVDIKHNYYGRYLNKLKEGPLKRQSVPSNFGANIPFDNANPVYGGKVMKLSIVNSRNCSCNNDKNDIKLVYESASNFLQDKILTVQYEFSVGDFVYARKNEEDPGLYKAIIVSIDNGLYSVKFVDDETIRNNLVYSDLTIYYECECLENNDTIIE